MALLYNKGATPAWGRALVATDCSWSTRRIPRRLRRGIPSCRHPLRLPFLFCRAATAGSGACAASPPATGAIKETSFVYHGFLVFCALLAFFAVGYRAKKSGNQEWSQYRKRICEIRQSPVSRWYAAVYGAFLLSSGLTKRDLGCIII